MNWRAAGCTTIALRAAYPKILSVISRVVSAKLNATDLTVDIKNGNQNAGLNADETPTVAGSVESWYSIQLERGELSHDHLCLCVGGR